MGAAGGFVGEPRRHNLSRLRSNFPLRVHLPTAVISHGLLGSRSGKSACCKHSDMLRALTQHWRGISRITVTPHASRFLNVQPIRMASTFPDLPIFRAIAAHDPYSTAIIHSKSNRQFTYGELLNDVENAKIRLYDQLKATVKENESIGGQRVAILIENSYDYVGRQSPRVEVWQLTRLTRFQVTLLSIFACDSIAVPLSASFPANELRYILEDSEAKTLLASERFQDKAKDVLQAELQGPPKLHLIEKGMRGSGHDEVTLIPLPKTKGGLMLYTSGTTSRPVGWQALR